MLKVIKRIDEIRDRAEQTCKMLDENKFYLECGQYAKFRRKISKGECGERYFIKHGKVVCLNSCCNY